MNASQPTRKAVARWLETRDTLHLVGMVVGALVGLGTVMSFFIGIGVKLAKDDFMTIEAAKERDAAIVRQLETRIASGEALASQREAALTQRIESLRGSQDEANTRMQNAIDRIYNLLLQARR